MHTIRKHSFLPRSAIQKRERASAYTAARAILLYAEILLEQRDVEQVASLEYGVARGCRCVWAAERAVADLGPVIRLCGNNLVAAAFVGWDPRRIGEAVGGEVDACDGSTGYAEAGKGEKDGRKWDYTVHLRGIGVELLGLRVKGTIARYR